METTQLPVLSTLHAIRPVTRAAADLAFFLVPLVLVVLVARS